jgi:two-component system CheB/CheR fusion protein
MADLALVPHVLVVEDNRAVADMIAALVKHWRWLPLVASDGPSALETVRTSKVDVIVLNLGLPGMDGYEVARRIRGQPGMDKVPIVTTSGDGSPGAGCGPHLEKPFHPEALRQALVGALGDR